MLKLTGTIRIVEKGDAVQDENKKYFRYRGISFHPTKKDLNQFVTIFDYTISEKRAKLIREGAIVEIYGTFMIKVDADPKTGEMIANLTCNPVSTDIIYTPYRKDEESEGEAAEEE